MGAHLLAAEAAADATVAWKSQGDRRAAAAAERRAGDFIQQCDSFSTPAMQAMEVRSQLTPAERDVAALAAAGRSNKGIAADLGLSVRTVENQLWHVYQKLGIKGRSELKEILESEPQMPCSPTISGRSLGHPADSAAGW
jgi:DNA-binding CsgD family transcriptional regulator